MILERLGDYYDVKEQIMAMFSLKVGVQWRKRYYGYSGCNPRGKKIEYRTKNTSRLHWRYYLRCLLWDHFRLAIRVVLYHL